MVVCRVGGQELHAAMDVRMCALPSQSIAAASELSEVTWYEDLDPSTPSTSDIRCLLCPAVFLRFLISRGALV